MTRFISLLFILIMFCPASLELCAGADNIYDGMVYGVFKPLETAQTNAKITVSGGTFTYVIDKTIGQIISAKALGDEFIAPGTSFPNPYVGLMPENDPGARRIGGKDRPRFGYEKAVEMRPLLWSGDLTDAYRFDASKSINIKTKLVSSGPEFVEVNAAGLYAWHSDGRPTPLYWEINYLFDVDGFTKITVELRTKRSVKLRWNCFNHVYLAKNTNSLLTRSSELKDLPPDARPQPTVPIANIRNEQPLLTSHWCPFIHFGNRLTGIEFSKEDFTDRWSGYRDSSVRLENGRSIHTGSVETKDGETLRSHDSRGRRGIFTQVYMRESALEYEEFDIRNTTFPFEPEDVRRKQFWVQLTPAKKPREDLNSLRVVWPGPHQIYMVRWRGRTQPWSPPSDEQVKVWAQEGINLIVGGANYLSGDFSRPTDEKKVRRFIEQAHRYGIMVIPYVTFSDYSFAAPGYQENAAHWAASKAIEYANCTTLMCFGAEGWRQHWEREVDLLLKRFDFDGLFIDHWFHTRICTNSRHGCSGYVARYVTEGYHDFAKRARKLVARHTNGKGIMMLNANMLLFSGVVPWFDIRLNGDNTDPRSIPGESMVTFWNARAQGVQSLTIWRDRQDSFDMMNFCTAFMFPFHHWSDPDDSIQGAAAPRPRDEIDLARFLWGTWRFFGLNRSYRFSSFDSSNVVDMNKSGSLVNAFSRDGRVLVVMSFLKTKKEQDPEKNRDEVLKIISPETLGLKPNIKYRIVDFNNNRYLDQKKYTLNELKKIPVRLIFGTPLIIMIAPEQTAPRLVYFRGVDDLTTEKTADRLTFRTKTAPGSPLSLYIDDAGIKYRSLTEGIAKKSDEGDFTVFSGLVPDDGVV
ncbi:MAG: DUF6259 domain-containing protein, partial [Planctomycetota bacterium]